MWWLKKAEIKKNSTQLELELGKNQLSPALPFFAGAHNSAQREKKLFLVGGWWVGGWWLVGEAENKTNSALLSWGLAELGNKD